MNFGLLMRHVNDQITAASIINDFVSIEPLAECPQLKFQVILTGPIDSPYEGGKFKLRLVFPFHYPKIPPLITFRTPIFHPNINSKGEICLSVLRKKYWDPEYTLNGLLLSIHQLMSDPNFDDPLVGDVAATAKDPQLFESIAREWTLRFAIK